jgi:hypothetical protein
VWLHDVADLVREENGRPISLLGVAIDITGRKLAEGQIVKLNSLKEQLLGTNSLDEKLKSITDGIVEIFGADFARIWITKGGDLCDEGCIHATVSEGPGGLQGPHPLSPSNRQFRTLHQYRRNTSPSAFGLL